MATRIAHLREPLFERAGGHCEVSGRPLRFETFDMHHRRPGGHGGTRRLGQHDLGNLLALAPEVHNLDPRSVHLDPTWSRPRGYLLSTSCPDPALVPVLLLGRVWVFLRRDGGAANVPAPVRAVLERGLGDPN